MSNLGLDIERSTRGAEWLEEPPGSPCGRSELVRDGLLEWHIPPGALRPQVIKPGVIFPVILNELSRKFEVSPAVIAIEAI